MHIHYKAHIDEEIHENCCSSSNNETTELFLYWQHQQIGDKDLLYWHHQQIGDKDLPSSSLSDKWIISTDRAHLNNCNLCTTLHTNTWNIIQICSLEFFFYIVSG